MVRRRRVLRSGLAALAVGVAGCSGGNADDSVPVLDDEGDVFALVFDLGTDDATDDDPRSWTEHLGRTSFGDRLQEGAVVSVQLAAENATAVTQRLRIPDGLGGKRRVALPLS